MSKLQAVGFLALSVAAPGEIVVWKASGSLDEGNGVLLREDLAANTQLKIRVTYDDAAIPQNRVNLPFPGRFEDDFRTNIKLGIILTVGNFEWQGFVESASPDAPTTFHTFTFKYPGAEVIDLTIDTSDNGTFPKFPFRIAEEPARFELSLRGTNNTFLGSGIAPLAIDPSALSSATGIVSNGTGNNLGFTLEPSAFEILFEKDELLPPIAPMVSSVISNNSISLTWLSDIRFRYRIEGTSDLSASGWTTVETRNGTSTPITRSYPLANNFRFYRVVAIQR